MVGMSKQADPRAPLSDSEWAVMKAIWAAGSTSIGEIHEQLAGDGRWAYTTVRTMVRRLVAKGWLGYRQVGNSFLYSPRVTEVQAVRSAVREFADRVLDGRAARFVTHYAAQRKLRAQDVAELRELLRQQGGKRGK